MKKYIIPFAIITLFILYFSASSLYSDDKGGLEFSHKLHVVENELECLTCHEQAEESETGKDDMLPSKSVCNDCHDADEVGNPELVQKIQDYSPKFSHKKHVASGLECESCHADVVQAEEAGAYVLPKMMDCMNCHQGKAVSNECSTCHLREENLLPASHVPTFKHNHSDLARAQVKDISADMTCTTCHTQNFCQDCHEGDNLDRLTHPLNYEMTHALEAQSRERECAVCHMERSFCFECHRERGIMPHNHKAGWANNIPNNGGRHSIEALNDMESCIACHEQNAEQTCQPCHPAN
jgi:hypothetical protein